MTNHTQEKNNESFEGNIEYLKMVRNLILVFRCVKFGVSFQSLKATGVFQIVGNLVKGNTNKQQTC
jgi:hypothetical protein